ncbi:MAG: lytic murein transglycosylase, partial [Hyphomicrobiales bacterium]
MIRGAGLALALLAACWTPVSGMAASSPPLPPGASAEPLTPAQIAGWAADDHSAALAIFARGCQTEPSLRASVAVPAALASVCEQAQRLAASGPVGPDAARTFFERHFSFWRIRPPSAPSGFMTGYFEPEFEGSLTRSDRYPTPLYGRPPDLVTRMPGDDWPGLDASLSAARRTASGLEPFHDRKAIETGALDGRNLEILWMRDPVDRFVLQVQGSGRIRLPDGQVTRLVYSGRNGHAYTSLGRVLSEREGIPPAQMTMDKLIGRLKADSNFARDLIRLNRSFVFFARRDDLPPESGPIGGAGLPLTPLRSIAIDRTIWPYGLPVWIDATLPKGDGGMERLARLTIAQDTG